MTAHTIAIDQGTTSTRAMAFDATLRPVATAQVELTQHYPRPGWVEHDPEEIWRATASTVREAMGKAKLDARDIAAIGITNQRETSVLWDRATGKPLHRAIVWQDRRTADTCARLKAEGHEPMVSAKTGLLLDPYFSATKLAWLIGSVEGAHDAAQAGRLAFGTIDTFLLWRLTGGRVHATDATNASRTMLFDIAKGDWDEDLLRLFGVPRGVLPEVRDSAGEFGETDPALFGAPIAVRGIAGDQQAATIGQGCFSPGMMKATFGTGCFALIVTGDTPVPSRNRLLTTVAWQLAGKRAYALEGSIFIAGAVVQWLRDGLGIIRSADEADALAAKADPQEDVVVVPAFVGLGAPWWDANARGAIHGLTRKSGAAEIARAALESVALQTRDLVEAMRADWPAAARPVVRVDGGMAKSAFTMQALADLIDAEVDRPSATETTALGAAYLAGLASGLYPQPAEFAASWRSETRFSPKMDAATRAAKIARWTDAVARTLSHR